MTNRPITTKELNILFPIRNLTDEHKEYLQKSLSTEIVPKNTTIFSLGADDDKQLYLLEGKIKLTLGSNDERIIEGGGMEARFPLDNNSPHKATAVALTNSTVLYFKKTFLTKLSDTEPTSNPVSSVDVLEDNSESILYNQLYFEVSQEIQADRLEIPSIPETANKVRSVISNENITSDQIAKLAQTDPAISTQLIKVANSPLFRGREKIESLPNAITRLGLKAIGNLITSFTLRMVFKAKTKDIKQQISNLWLHSRSVASLCAVMSKKLKGFNTDKAMLVGLIHDIGAIPVLTHADKHPHLASEHTEVKQAVSRLTPIVGKMVMEKWNFTDDFISVAAEAKNWQRETQLPADFTDLVIVCQLMAFQNTPYKGEYPEPNSVPAYKRLVEALRDPSDSIDILENAKEELTEIQQLFN